MTQAFFNWRKAAGLTQAQAADLLGVKQPSIAKWESGQVSIFHVLSVERVTGIPRWKLRPDIYPEPPKPTRTSRKQGASA